MQTHPTAKDRFRAVNGLEPLLVALNGCASSGSAVVLPAISAVCAADDILAPGPSTAEASDAPARDCVRNFVAAVAGVRVTAGHPKVVPMCLRCAAVKRDWQAKPHSPAALASNQHLPLIAKRDVA